MTFDILAEARALIARMDLPDGIEMGFVRGAAEVINRAFKAGRLAGLARAEEIARVGHSWPPGKTEGIVIADAIAAARKETP